MDATLRLCPHLADDALGALPIDPDDVLDWYDGPVVAASRCPRCDATALAELIDWSASRAVRIYGLSALDPPALALFARNTSKGSCDPGRLARELDALLHAAGPLERLVARGPDGTILTSTAAEGAAPPSGPWPERIPARDDARWFARLGLDKT